MPKPTKSISDQVASKAKSLDRYLKKLEKLYDDRYITRTDIENAYAGCFLQFHTFLERSIEKLFIGLLRGRLVSHYYKIQPLVSIKSDTVAYAIIKGNQQYINWFPYENNTIPRAKAFLSCGRPFAELSKENKRIYSDISIIGSSLLGVGKG